MLVYPASMPVSNRALQVLADALRRHRTAMGSRWRRLPPGRQALLVLAHLRKGETYTALAGGFGVGTTTVFRYVREGVDVLAAVAPTLDQALDIARRKAFVILDGTLLSIDRVGMASGYDRAFFSGKHKRHGVNVQVIADPAGRLVWASPALPGARHDMGAAREHGIIDALNTGGISVWADTAYQGGGSAIRVPSADVTWIQTPVVIGGCRARRRRSTPPMPVSAVQENGRTPSSSPGRPCGRSAVARAGQPTWSRL